VYGMPCAGKATSWSLNDTTPRPILAIHHPEGAVLLELNSAPSRGLLALLKQAFGPQSVSKVHA